eukprot:scaffold877_cov362-Prasinococcus_capsulatus_cf.AAC.7
MTAKRSCGPSAWAPAQQVGEAAPRREGPRPRRPARTRPRPRSTLARGARRGCEGAPLPSPVPAVAQLPRCSRARARRRRALAPARGSTYPGGWSPYRRHTQRHRISFATLSARRFYCYRRSYQAICRS